MSASSAALKKERRAPPLAAVGEGYLVARRRPLSELPPEKQEQIRQAYFDTAWASDYCLELFGFYTDLETAEERAAQYDGGLVLSLPVNAVRPDGLGRYGTQTHPNSPARERYEETSPGLTRVDRSEFEKLSREIKEHAANLESIAS